MARGRIFALKVLKRVLDLGIILYALLIPIIILTGGVKITILGVSIKANHLYTPLKILLPLLFLRLLITVQIRNFILVIASLLAGLFVMEAGMRIWNPPISSPFMSQIHRPSAAVGWELVPGSYGIGTLAETYRVNRFGFRDRDFSEKKADGVYRIVAMGDSFTFGAGVNLDDTYPKQIERMLLQKKINCEVINAGVIGHDMWQHLEMLKAKVLPLNPDLVILGVFLNDLSASLPPYKNQREWQGLNPFEPQGFSGVMSKIYLWNFLKNANAIFEYKYRYRRGYLYLKGIEDRRKTWGPTNPTDLNYQIMSGKAENRLYEDFSNTLAQFVSRCRAGGAQVLILMIPDSVQLHDQQAQKVNRIVEQACEKIGVPFFDLTHVLESEKNPESLYLFPIDAHNSPEGLRLIARAVSEEILKLGFLSNAR